MRHPFCFGECSRPTDTSADGALRKVGWSISETLPRARRRSGAATSTTCSRSGAWVATVEHLSRRLRLVPRPEHEHDRRRNQAQCKQHGHRPDRHCDAKRNPGDDDQRDRYKPHLNQFRSSHISQHGGHITLNSLSALSPIAHRPSSNAALPIHIPARSSGGYRRPARRS